MDSSFSQPSKALPLIKVMLEGSFMEERFEQYANADPPMSIHFI